MRKVQKPWVAMLMGALLLGTLVGAVWARPHDRPEAQDITRKITIPAGSFSPAFASINWLNSGDEIHMASGTGTFMAPVVFPCLPSVTVERFILYASDSNASWSACAGLCRTRLPQGDEAQIGYVCSQDTGGAVQPFTDSTISPNVVWPAHGAYVWISVNTNMEVHGVRIEYHRNI